ncbi:BldC family transcriptional regulator [Actinomadura terrae]|uniref:BldC family transcriptional regulator n=1 Tax=Actinomadura terrae TaxID=604353 RepID=UPI001FA7A625|nr:BldC family transcriptional regulator [Actinomadura terrae]
MPQKTTEIDALLTPAEVAVMFRVDAKTVNRWAQRGLIPHVWTLGGHRRYPEKAVRELLARDITRREA